MKASIETKIKGEIDRINQTIHKCARDLQKKLTLFKPKLSESIVSMINDVLLT
jgi:hypothetical protein